MKQVVEALQYLRKHFYFINGLIALLVFVGIAYCIVVPHLAPHILVLARWCGCPIQSEFAHCLYLVGLGLMLLAAFCFWRLQRRVPRFRNRQLGVIFAPNPAKELESDVQRLFDHLEHELKSHEFANQFVLRRLPPHLSVRSVEEAGRVLRQSSGTAAVWGLVASETSEEGRRTGFSRISFTIVHRPVRLSQERYNTVALAIAGIKRQIRERNQIADQQIMARDIGVVVRHLIGLVLMINRRYEDAVKVFMPLLPSLDKMRTAKKSVGLNRFRMQTQCDLAYCMTMASSEEYGRYLVSNKLYDIPRGRLQAWINHTKQASNWDSQNSMHYLSRAIYQFLLGEVDQAIRTAQKAKRIAPRAVAVPNFSLAFLFNFKGDCVKSRREYRLGLAKKTSYDEGMIQQCLHFIRQTLRQYPDRKQLRLALGLIEYHRGTRETGVKELETFLNAAGQDPKLAAFADEARRLLADER